MTLVMTILCVKLKPQRFLKSDVSLSATLSQSKSEIPSTENVKDSYQDLCSNSVLNPTNLNQE